MGRAQEMNKILPPLRQLNKASDKFDFVGNFSPGIGLGTMEP
jgi:hypothetical protein